MCRLPDNLNEDIPTIYKFCLYFTNVQIGYDLGQRKNNTRLHNFTNILETRE